MGMALDEPSSNDEVHKEQGFDVVIEKNLLNQLGGVRIDFEKSKWRGAGFRITPTYGSGGSCC